jgi:hypothetical protein
MKTASIFALTLLVTSNCFSNEHGHGLGAHEHGSIKVGIAIEGNTAEIDIDGPAESFLGFEYAPKTSKEKKVFTEAQIRWTKNLESMIAFDKQLNCKVTQASFEQEEEIEKVKTDKASHSKTKDSSKKESGIHSDIEAKAKVSCKSNISGSQLTVSLKKIFKNIKKLSVEVIGTETKSIEITQAVQSFKI